MRGEITQEREGNRKVVQDYVKKKEKKMQFFGAAEKNTERD